MVKLIIDDLDFCETENLSSTELYGGYSGDSYSSGYSAVYDTSYSSGYDAGYYSDLENREYGYGGYAGYDGAAAGAYAAAASDGSIYVSAYASAIA